MRKFCRVWMFLLLPICTQVILAQRPLAVEHDKFFMEQGKKWLYGGEDPESHFDVSNCVLLDSQFHYGIGRETFPALIEPVFVSIKVARKVWKDKDRFIVCQIGTETRAYSVKDLTRHEVVNDVIGGRPVYAAYCVLADLGAMYDRTIDNKVFTFALSGYTYFDTQIWDGLDGFVFWDRETESLWWPLIGEAVSGKMKGTSMQVLDEKYWKQTTWEDVRKNHKHAQVLKTGQDFSRPQEWPKYENVKPQPAIIKAVAPKWGKQKGKSE